MRRTSPRPIAPLCSRAAAMLVVLLQIIAPIWHVCALAGHAAPARPNGTHHGALTQTATVDGGPRRPLICWCAPPPDPNPGGPKLSPTASHGEHESCLALLLQTMPGALAVAPQIRTAREIIVADFAVCPTRAPFLALLNRFRGRAPPAAT